MDSNHFDVVVIGAGVLGAFHAYFAIERGLRVALIERGDMPNDASVRNFGTIVPSAMTPGEWHRRGMETVEVYRSLAERLPIGLQFGGTQYLASTDAERTVIEEFARLGPERGWRCTLLDQKDSIAINPTVDPAYCQASLHFPDDLRVDSRRLFATFIPWLRDSLGCIYLPRTVAVQVEGSDGGCVVNLASGQRLTAEHVFVCTGADYRTLFPRLFAASGLGAYRLQMLRTKPQGDQKLGATIASGLSIRWYASFRMCPSWSALAKEPTDPEIDRRGIHILLVQDADGRLVVGDSHEYTTDDFPAPAEARTEELILREAARMTRFQNWQVDERWLGIYPSHPTEPLFRQTIGERVHIVTGIGGKGMTTGPAVARESIDALSASLEPAYRGLV